jgi:hypothetical protein
LYNILFDKFRLPVLWIKSLLAKSRCPFCRLIRYWTSLDQTVQRLCSTVHLKIPLTSHIQIKHVPNILCKVISCRIHPFLKYLQYCTSFYLFIYLCAVYKTAIIPYNPWCYCAPCVSVSLCRQKCHLQNRRYI